MLIGDHIRQVAIADSVQNPKSKYIQVQMYRSNMLRIARKYSQYETELPVAITNTSYNFDKKFIFVDDSFRQQQWIKTV